MMITVRVQPKAKRDEVVGWMSDGSLKVRVKEPPEGGRANVAVQQLLATTLNVSAHEIDLVSGATERIKRFRVPDSISRPLRLEA